MGPVGGGATGCWCLHSSAAGTEAQEELESGESGHQPPRELEGERDPDSKLREQQGHPSVRVRVARAELNSRS